MISRLFKELFKELKKLDCKTKFANFTMFADRYTNLLLTVCQVGIYTFKRADYFN